MKPCGSDLKKLENLSLKKEIVQFSNQEIISSVFTINKSNEVKFLRFLFRSGVEQSIGLNEENKENEAQEYHFKKNSHLKFVKGKFTSNFLFIKKMLVRFKPYKKLNYILNLKSSKTKKVEVKNQRILSNSLLKKTKNRNFKNYIIKFIKKNFLNK